MAGWEDELASLLDELGVKQEESPSHPGGEATSKSTNTTPGPRRKFVSRQLKRRERHEDRRIEPYTGAFPDAHLRNKETSIPSEKDDDLWSNDPGAMRREIDSIVKQVIRQMQTGNLAPALKDDIMIVLRALRRRAMATQQAGASDEAYLESATAMLHFCRLVLQLTEQDIRDF